jgi:hypothetical protein
MDRYRLAAGVVAVCGIAIAALSQVSGLGPATSTAIGVFGLGLAGIGAFELGRGAP